MKTLQNFKSQGIPPRLLPVSIFLLLSALSFSNGQINQSMPMPIQEGVIYPGFTQDVRSYNFFSFQITNKSAAFLNSTYLSIRVDIDDATSDPDILIGKANSGKAPKFEAEAEQYCVKTGSNVCFLKKNSYKLNDVLQFSVRCVNKCAYTLRIAFSSVANVTDGSKLPMRLDGRANQVFQFQIPEVSQDGLTQSIYFQVDTVSTQSPIQIYFSSSDDLSLMEERDGDIITDTGKAIKFTQDDYGWCTRCSVFFIVSVRAPDSYLISGKCTSRKEFLQDQITLNRQFNQQQRECFAYPVAKATNDVVFFVRQQQGDLDVSVSFRNALNTTIEQQIILSEVSSSRAVIVRSTDRQRFTQFANSLLYLCATPYTDASLLITPSQQYQLSRFDALDDYLYSFTLDSQDYVYFRYTSPFLASSRQIQVQIQAFNTNSTGTIPRVFFRVCSSPNAEECNLSDNLAMGFWDGNVILTEINSQVDTSTMSRVGIINHNPTSCPIPTQCYYLISVFKDDQAGLQKSTFKLSLINQDPVPVGLFQQYSDVISQGQLQYFQVMFTANQLTNLNITNLYFNLTTFNGKADLIFSTTNRNPNLTNNEMRMRSLSQWVQIPFNATGRDLSKTNLYLAVFGNSQTQFQLRIGADYFLNNPTNYQNQTFNTISQSNITLQILNITNQTNQTNSTQQNTSGNILIPGVTNTSSLTIYPSPLVEGMRGQYYMSSNMTDIIVFYQPTFQPSSQRLLHFSPTIDSMTQNSSLNFNVTYGNQSWNNNTIGLTILPDQWKFDPSSIFTIRIRADFSRVNRTALNNTNATRNVSQATKQSLANILLNLTIRFGIFQSFYSNRNTQTAYLNTYYEGYANYTTVVFKHLLMDTNGTYVFTLFNTIGKPYFMQKNGPLLLQDYDIDDDTTYDFASSSVDSQETQVITVTRAMRENANFRCKNASYPLRGGNENCTMFVAIQCDQICIFNFSIALLEAKNRIVDVPLLFKEGQDMNQQIVTGNGKPINYFYPFVRQQIKDTTITLTKQTNDSFIVARIISNAHLPYQNWNYPTQNSYDYISRTPQSSFELIDLPTAILQSKCIQNTSCALLISVFSASTLNTSRSSYKLSFLGSYNRMGNATLVNGFISQANTYDYYWFLINSTGTAAKPAIWKHLITVSTNGNSSDQEVDLYLQTSDGSLPTSENFDFKGDRLGNDAITLSSDLNFFKNQTRDRYLIIIGIKAKSNNVSYTLMNWGPNNYDSQLISFTDIQLRQFQNFSLQSRNLRPVNNYRILRFFNYGSRDLSFNITATDGQIFVLANNNRFKHYQVNSYFTVPIVAQSSKIAPQNMNKSQSFTLRINQNTNSRMLCSFCWIYIAVFQNNSVASASSGFSINVTDNANTDYIQTLRIGETQSQVLALAGSSLQRRFMFDSKEQFTLSVQSGSNTTAYSVFVGFSTDYLNNERIWQASSNSRLTFKQKQSDRNFSIGTFYYVTVVSNQSLTNITLSLNQRRTVGLLRDQTSVLDRMQTSEDYIKYYYFVPPSVPINFTATITITPRTQGFFPSFYVQRNDIINNTFNFSRLQFPSMRQSTFSQEQQFYMTPQNSYTFSYNLSAVSSMQQLSYNVSQNVTVNQTIQVNVTQTVLNTTTKKNQTVTVLQNQTVLVNTTRNTTVVQNIPIFNQTYYTMAIYWNNFGLTDIQRAEFEIAYSIRPLGRNMIVQDKKPIQMYLSQKFLQPNEIVVDNENTGFLNGIGESIQNLVDMIQFI